VKLGASFTSLTREGERCRSRSSVPSLTVTVMTALPLRFAAGATVTVRLVPPAAEDDVAIRHQCRVVGQLPLTLKVVPASTSPIVNASALVAASSLMVRSAMSLDRRVRSHR